MFLFERQMCMGINEHIQEKVNVEKVANTRVFD